jgi:hypothetical protein
MREGKWIVVALVLVVVAVGVSYYLFVSERERQLAIQEEVAGELDLEPEVLEDKSTGELQVTLYLYNPGATESGRNFLRKEERTIFETGDPVLTARQVVRELLTESKEGQSESEDQGVSLQTFSPQGHLRQLYLLEDGTAVVDLSQEVAQGILGGVIWERAVIESITRSLRENVDQIKRVFFLVEGQQRRTLAGHVSIEAPFM